MREGTVISGTHQPRDLIPAFLEEVRRLAPDSNDPVVLEAAVWAKEGRELDLDTEAADLICDGLFLILESIAPPGFYFGAREGDGADFGWWRMPQEWEYE